MMVGSDRAAPRAALRGAVAAAAGSRPQEAFARTLREKSLAAEGADAGDDADGNGTGNGSSQASALTCPIATLPGLAGPSPAPACDGAVDGPSDGSTAGIEAAGASAAAMAGRAVLGPTAIDGDPIAWEASIGDGSGVAIELRAEMAPAVAGERAAWSVTIVSPTLATEILARHAPHLTDRLRRHGIGSRVRIDGTLEDRGGARE